MRVLIHYEGYSKNSKTNSKKYFIYEINKIIFLHSFHPIHNTSVSDVSIEKFQDGIIRIIKHSSPKAPFRWSGWCRRPRISTDPLKLISDTTFYWVWRGAQLVPEI